MRSRIRVICRVCGRRFAGHNTPIRCVLEIKRATASHSRSSDLLSFSVSGRRAACRPQRRLFPTFGCSPFAAPSAPSRTATSHIKDFIASELFHGHVVPRRIPACCIRVLIGQIASAPGALICAMWMRRFSGAPPRRRGAPARAATRPRARSRPTRLVPAPLAAREAGRHRRSR